MNNSTAMHHSAMANIVIVDDNLSNLALLTSILAEQDYKVRRAISGAVALRAIQTAQPDLILLDINLPDMTGYEVCAQLKQDPSTRDIPIIFISALNETLDKVKAFTVGGVDYISKPFEMAEVLARIENQLSLQRAKAEIQQLNGVLEERVCQRTLQLEKANCSLEQEIAEREAAQQQLLHMLRHDALTHLPNWLGLTDTLTAAIQRTKDDLAYHFALILFDCDRFHLINTSLGHTVGDRVLIQISQRLAACLPPGAMLARLGGDEFLIFLDNIQDLGNVEQCAQQFQHRLSQPIQLDPHTIFVSASMGIVVSDLNYNHPEHLLRDADTALYQAKQMGKAQCQIFSAEMHEQAEERLQVETDLRCALSRGEFTLHYQPIVSLLSGQIMGVEALIRWHHPTQGFVSPAKFIPIAEENGLIIPIGNWVLREACLQLQRWQQEILPPNSPFFMSVNCSPKQFLQPDLLFRIDEVLKATEIDACRLKLEITESAFMENTDLASVILAELRSRQIQLAIDDFGTGYSSLSYLHRFPVDTLKIDQAFIRGLIDNSEYEPPFFKETHNFRIVRSTINLAHDLGMDIVAEGIETEVEVNLLRVLNCDLGQGYHWAKPLNSEAAAQLIKSEIDNKKF
ncbi:MAG: EAL domain-containing protein [Thermosynechococcaceae cyanobacterium]